MNKGIKNKDKIDTDKNSKTTYAPSDKGTSFFKYFLRAALLLSVVIICIVYIPNYYDLFRNVGCITSVDLKHLEEGIYSKIDENKNQKNLYCENSLKEKDSEEPESLRLAVKYRIILLSHNIQDKIWKGINIAEEINALKLLLKDSFKYEILILDDFSHATINGEILITQIESIILSKSEQKTGEVSSLSQSIRDSWHKIFKVRKRSDIENEKKEFEVLKSIAKRLKDKDLKGIHYELQDIIPNPELNSTRSDERSVVTTTRAKSNDAIFNSGLGITVDQGLREFKSNFEKLFTAHEVCTNLINKTLDND